MENFLIEKKYKEENIESFIDLNQKKNLFDFLDFICSSKKIDIEEQNKILVSLREKLLIYFLNRNETIDEYIIANLVTYQKMKIEQIEVNFEELLKFINFIKVFTVNINITSQIMSNCTNLLNNIIDDLINKYSDSNELKNDNFFSILKLTELNIELTKNISSYNPRIIIHISRIFHYIFDVSDSKDEENNKFNNKISNIFYPILKEKASLKERKEFVITKLSSLLFIYSENLKNDLNFDIIFKTIYSNIIEQIKKNDEVKKYFTSFLELYNDIINKIIQKKLFPMNFLVIKKKPLVSLEPDIDLSFLGDYPEFTNKEEKKKKMDYILKHKVRSNEKQAIRKFKKEARVIDEERQKVIDRINLKRKEDIKFVNQYLEQQNIEYKKMMSSNPKRRFKFKKNKGK